MNNQSKLISLLHDITQLEYCVEFSGDFEGMITVTYVGEGLDWRHHQHLGFPGCEKSHLEDKLIESLEAFLKDLQSKQNISSIPESVR